MVYIKLKATNEMELFEQKRARMVERGGKEITTHISHKKNVPVKRL